MISLDEELKFNTKEVAFREIEGVGLSMRSGDISEVEGAGLYLLRQIIKKRTTCRSLAASLAEYYRILPDQALEDVLAFVSQLTSHGLLVEPHQERHQSEHSLSTQCNPIGVSQDLRCWRIARDRRIPLKCKLELTYRCNVACRFCYNGPRPGLPGSYVKETELKIAELRRILLELYEVGTFILTISGGEPFVRKDLIDLLEITDELGLAVEILTNGTLITPNVARALALHRLQLVVVPLFGVKASTHDTFVRTTGAFEKACRGIEALLAAGIEVGVRCAITRANYTEWQDVRMLAERWGARYFPHVQVHLSSDGKVDLRESLRLDVQSIKELLDTGLEVNPGYHCEAGFARIDVLPNGDVAVCSLITEPLGNLRVQSFAEIWDQSIGLQKFRSQMQKATSACACRHVDSSQEFYSCNADSLFDEGSLRELSPKRLQVMGLNKNQRNQ